jgi:hypothetical protein
MTAYTQGGEEGGKEREGKLRDRVNIVLTRGEYIHRAVGKEPSLKEGGKAWDN